MFLKKILLVFLVFVSTFTNAQQLTLGTKTYPSTPVLNFSSANAGGSLLYTPCICIGKKSDGSGLLLITVLSSFYVNSQQIDIDQSGYNCVGGTLYIYLKGTDAIKCVDRRNYSSMNGSMQNTYYLTSSEMQKLLKYDISSIMFHIGNKDTWNGGAKNLKSYTARYCAVLKSSYCMSNIP